MAKRFGIMLDCSRNAIMRVEELKKYLLVLKKMGYNMIQLYTEDTYEVDDEPYFGYLRGRYSKAEMKEIVAYCDEIGVEAIPCIQTLAHLENMFKWNEYKSINDFGNIMLVGEERTYQLIENMVKTVRECYTTGIIHIGMDEAHMLGLGKYLDKHGLRNRFDILNEHEVSTSEPFEMDFTDKIRVWFQMTRPEEKQVNLKIRVFEDGKEQFEENIRETVHDPEVICNLLKQAGFQVEKCADRLLEDSGRGTTWFVVARKS